MASSKKNKYAAIKPPLAEVQKAGNKKPLIRLNFINLLLFSLFCFLLFKNISYPLLWNDESDTAMNAKQVMKYGYAKVHDGSKVIFLPESYPWVGYIKAYDITAAAVWANFYFATIGVSLANHVDDLYVKTALVRTPFAIMGLFGLIIFVLSFREFFTDPDLYKKFIAFFILIESFSVSLFLHMRQARYYSLVIFIVACFFYVFIHYYFLKKYSYRKYLIWMALVLFLTYLVNVPAFTVCCLFLGLYEVFNRFAATVNEVRSKKKIYMVFWNQFQIAVKNLFPLLICLVITFPIIIFLHQLDTASSADSQYGSGLTKYLYQLNRVFYVLKTQEFLYPAIFVKLVQLIVWYVSSSEQKKKTKITSLQNGPEKLTSCLMLFFICYALIIAKLPFLYTRYFIVLQPIIILSMLMDSVIILKYLSARVKSSILSFVSKLVFFTIIAIAASYNAEAKINYFEGYIFQITHQYKGPLDYLIPFIKEKYPKTDSLVIATNYEELSYIYFLNCNIVMGFDGLKDKPKTPPDIIIYRKAWGKPEDYNALLQKASYTRISFPIYDYPVNDIPELDFVIQHQFKTKWTDVEQEKTDIFIKNPDQNKIH